jgi:hypothetical protein
MQAPSPSSSSSEERPDGEEPVATFPRPPKHDDVLFSVTAKQLKFGLVATVVAIVAILASFSLMRPSLYPRPKIKLQLTHDLTVTGEPKMLTIEEIKGVRETYKHNTLTLDDIRGSAIMDLQANERRRIICALHYNEPINLCVLRLETPLNGREFVVMHNLNITAWMPMKRYSQEGSPFCGDPNKMFKVERFVGVTASFFDSDGLPWQMPMIEREAFGVQHAVRLNALEHPCSEEPLEKFRRRLEHARYYKVAYSPGGDN